MVSIFQGELIYAFYLRALYLLKEFLFQFPDERQTTVRNLFLCLGNENKKLVSLLGE